MGTVERGESNLSFQNILKLSNSLGMRLADLFEGLEEKAKVSAPRAKQPAIKTAKRSG